MRQHAIHYMRVWIFNGYVSVPGVHSLKPATMWLTCHYCRGVDEVRSLPLDRRNESPRCQALHWKAPRLLAYILLCSRVLYHSLATQSHSIRYLHKGGCCAQDLQTMDDPDVDHELIALLRESLGFSNKAQVGVSDNTGKVHISLLRFSSLS
jgi:hypothetical protein